MAKWFEDQFLPSIFQRAGVNNHIWLSAKQTAVCVRHMEEHTMRYEVDKYGTTYKSKYYTYIWGQRKVNLQYSKKNGCGTIEFGPSAAEQGEIERQAQAEREHIKAERIRLRKKNPERLAKEISRLESELETAIFFRDCLDGEESSQDEIDFWSNKVSEIKAEIALLTA